MKISAYARTFSLTILFLAFSAPTIAQNGAPANRDTAIKAALNNIRTVEMMMRLYPGDNCTINEQAISSRLKRIFSTIDRNHPSVNESGNRLVAVPEIHTQNSGEYCTAFIRLTAYVGANITLGEDKIKFNGPYPIFEATGTSVYVSTTGYGGGPGIIDKLSNALIAEIGRM
ncbi:MAG TPA: hypothetical protein VEH84_17875 [Alphaproteobacteria bacterium]|nr:hypothetical protein [Alphaproteobacteria bacterium]